MALFPTFQDANDDDPRFDTSGKKEVVDVADLPDEAPEIVAKQDAPVATEAPKTVTKKTEVPEAAAAVPKAAPEVAPEGEPISAPAQTPEASNMMSPEEAEASDASLAHPNYFDLPKGKPVKQDFTERRITKIDGGEELDSVTPIMDAEAFKKEAEAHLALHQEVSDSNTPDWIIKPDVWPSFVKFPSVRDLEAIRVAEENGLLDDERKQKFNEDFQKRSLLMQSRAAQIDTWIYEENDAFTYDERKRGFLFRPLILKNIEDLKAQRLKSLDEHEKSLGGNGGTHNVQDPFWDIKWAILLDPTASPNDPKFKNVARWGHNAAIMVDGGQLCVDEDGMHVPRGCMGTKMAAEAAVMEALERGWKSINIAGSEEFVEAAKEAALAAGLGAKLTTYYGFAGKSKPEYIMPKPPKLSGVQNTQDDTLAAHDQLMSDAGKEGSGEASRGHSPALKKPDIEPAEKAADTGGAPIADPFEGEDESDLEAARKLREAEAQNVPEPT
ncbi:hypothetical protein LCGC14_0112140 [marine sediment metagenome]|uniref:Large polyvalent protein-associated domain-containing protein n=1 Tax=marine sediment metagenome TaxID=412755 RepID=A0A0F9YBH3_9ZZZZ